MADYKWVADKAAPFLLLHPNLGAKELQEHLEQKYNVTLSYWVVWKGRQKAMDKIFGKWEESFELLFRFKAEVEMRSPGSVVEVDVQADGDGVYFRRFFCCFKACIDGFMNGCRPYLSVDSTALNGRWNGHLASATGVDGHNWMFPVAFGFFQSETTDNWTWFFEQLRRCIMIPHLAISSDACKGLENAVKDMYPWAEHRECFRHLMDNFVKRHQGPVFRNMYPAARAYDEGRFEHYMAKIFEASPAAKTWLDNNHKLKWMRSKFSEHIKCDYITNNLAEVWNNWVRDIKDLPVADLADTIRKKTLNLFARRSVIGERMQGSILPAVIHQLNAELRTLARFKVASNGRNMAEVDECGDDLELVRNVVNLATFECTCRQWQVTGKPCPHALAFITSQRNPSMEQYLHEYYSVKCFKLAYAGDIPCMPDKSRWAKVDLGFKVLPPLTKRTRGRQRKNRLKGCLEKGKGKWKVKCKRCGELGHRQTSSKCSLNGTKKRKRTAKMGRPQGSCSTPKTSQSQSTTVTTTSPMTRRLIFLMLSLSFEMWINIALSNNFYQFAGGWR